MDQSIKRYASNTEICFIDDSETFPVQEYSYLVPPLILTQKQYLSRNE